MVCLLGAAFFAALFGRMALASAAPDVPVTCINYRHNIEGTNNYKHQYDKAVKSRMWQANKQYCMRVSSIAVANGNGSVEFGWVLGYQPAAGNAYKGFGACADGNYFNTPELFVVWVPKDGRYHCEDFGSLALDSYGTFAVTNTNLNDWWGIFYGSTHERNVHVNFVRGWALTNGERHNNNDTAYGNFTHLKYQYVGGGSSWHPFNSSVKYYDDDSAYRWCKYSDTHTKVARTC